MSGQPYALLLDTGSSNLVVASSACTACDVAPRWPFTGSSSTTGVFNMIYGTGSADAMVAEAELSIGGLTISKGTLSAIVDQHAGVDGAALFPPASDLLCYDTYAGLLGLAYRGQDAGPASMASNGTTNGTTVPLLDQLVTEVGMPNAFAIELCDRYPQPCGPREDKRTWLPSRPCDVGYTVGNLYLGGYRSASLADEMRYTPISDEIHYDVVLRGVEVCGSRGCQNVTFPDQIGGETEDACVCSSESCPVPLGSGEYCYFAVVDSGADGLFMNTVGNAHALLHAMEAVGMVDFPVGQNSSSIQQSFYFNRTVVSGASPSEKGRFTVFFPDSEGASFGVDIRMDVIFRQTAVGLMQPTVQADLVAFQAAKFPVLLGSPLLMGRIVFFDRSRRRLGFASVRPESCGAPLADPADIDVRGLAISTPGAGCRRGTGSGGGCPQAKRPCSLAS